MNVLVTRYRHLFEHEKDSNCKLLAMLASVTEEKRADPRFQQAVNLAAHLAACRENWLDRMVVQGEAQVAWFEEKAELDDLPERFAMIEAAWTQYLAQLLDTDLAAEFEFPIRDGRRFRWYVEGQILQLIGHGNYHRGQIALLVDQLGGESVDTDYLFWVGSPDGSYRRVT